MFKSEACLYEPSSDCLLKHGFPLQKYQELIRIEYGFVVSVSFVQFRHYPGIEL